MAAIRRHWALVVAIPLLILWLLVAILQRGMDSRVAHAQASSASATTIPPNAQPQQAASQSQVAFINYRRIQRLRTQLALGSTDLAALGVSATTAQQIFTDVKTFTISSVGAWAAAETNYQIARHALQKAIRSVNVGTSDNAIIASIPTLEQAAATAAVAKSAVLSPLVTQINGLLTTDQQAMWQAAQSNAALQQTSGATPAPGYFRYVSGLTGDQIQQLDMAARRGVSANPTNAAQILSGVQLQQSQIALNNQQVSLNGIQYAEASVLPVPQMIFHPGTTTQPAPSPLPPAQ